jgi:hypothetical protein
LQEKKQTTDPAPEIADMPTLLGYEKTAYSENVNNFKPTEQPFVETTWDPCLIGLGGVVDLETAFNDDTTNFGLAKKKTMVKDTMIEKKS